MLFQRIGHCVDPTVPVRLYKRAFIALYHLYFRNDTVLLTEMHLAEVEYPARLDKGRFEHLVHLRRLQFLMPRIRNVFCNVPHRLAQAGGHFKSVRLFEHIAYAAFTRLRIDTDHVRIVFPAHVLRIDGKIGYVPHLAPRFGAEIHALCDRILMRAGKRGKHKLARIRLTGRNVEAGKQLVFFCNARHIRKIKSRFHALRIHIHSEGHEIAISRTFTVAEQRTLYAVGTCKQAELRGCNTRAAVVMRVYGEDDVLSSADVFIQKLHLLGIDMRHGVFDRGG